MGAEQMDGLWRFHLNKTIVIVKNSYSIGMTSKGTKIVHLGMSYQIVHLQILNNNNVNAPLTRTPKLAAENDS